MAWWSWSRWQRWQWGWNLWWPVVTSRINCRHKSQRSHMGLWYDKLLAVSDS
jgi:hypothetical protein